MAVKAKGSTITFGTFTGTNYKSFEGAGKSFDFTDTTVLLDDCESSVPTLMRLESIPFEALFDSTDFAALDTIADNQVDDGEALETVITYSDGSTQTFTAWLENIKPTGIEVGGVVMCSGTYKPTSKPVYSAEGGE